MPIHFKDVSDDDESPKNSRAADDLAGLVDAFTGERLNKALGLYTCSSCGVYYHRSSWEALEAQNHGRCIGCGRGSLSEAHKSSAQDVGRNWAKASASNVEWDFSRPFTWLAALHEVLKQRKQRRYPDLSRRFKLSLLAALAIFGSALGSLAFRPWSNDISLNFMSSATLRFFELAPFHDFRIGGFSLDAAILECVLLAAGLAIGAYIGSRGLSREWAWVKGALLGLIVASLVAIAGVAIVYGFNKFCLNISGSVILSFVGWLLLPFVARLKTDTRRKVLIASWSAACGVLAAANAAVYYTPK